MAEIPKSVPLPQVPQYTDEIVFDALNLPVGFDEEQLLVNVSAFNRVKAIAGLGNISITTISGNTENYSVGVNSVDKSGAATIGAAARRTKQPLSSGKVSFPSGTPLMGPANTIIRINNHERDARISEADAPKGPLNPQLQARMLNHGIKTGLHKANQLANMSQSKAANSLRYYGAMNILTTMGSGFNLEHTAQLEPFIIAAGPVMVHLALLRKLAAWNAERKSKDLPLVPLRRALTDYRQSIFIGCAVDRYIGATATIAASRFVTMQQ